MSLHGELSQVSAVRPIEEGNVIRVNGRPIAVEFAAVTSDSDVQATA